MPHGNPVTPTNAMGSILYVGIELSKKTWKLHFKDKQHAREVNLPAGNFPRLRTHIERTKRRFKLPKDCAVYSCYEAGCDGFWIHRKLLDEGIQNVVVDPGSIEVTRRGRRKKTDRLDADKLCRMLIRYHDGETKHWSVIRVPTPEAEDERRITRELERLNKEQRGLTCRIKSLFLLQGIQLGRGWQRNFAEKATSIKDGQGNPLRSNLKEELLRLFARWELVKSQVKGLEKERDRRVKEDQTETYHKVRQLQQVVGIGDSAVVLVLELFGWREFKNRKEVAACTGLTPTPHNTGESERELGISKAGNKRVRWLIIQLAWLWLRYQPHSDLSLWYAKRFGKGKRQRKIGIVALARRLLVALWRYLEYGEIPRGVRLSGEAGKESTPELIMTG